MNRCTFEMMIHDSISGTQEEKNAQHSGEQWRIGDDGKDKIEHAEREKMNIAATYLLCAGTD